MIAESIDGKVSKIMSGQIDKNIIMCLSPGRCGTNLLAVLLGLAEDTYAVHEPVPGFHSVVGSLQDDPDKAVEFVRDVKLPAIAATPCRNYVETSHQFGKGFFEAFVKLDIPFQMIVLNRDPREVAKSLWRVKGIPGRSAKRAKYLLHPEQDGVLRLPGWESMSDYQLCFWYCLEMERRKTLYSQKCKDMGICVTDVVMNDLLDFEKFQDFATALGLTVPDSAAAKHKASCSQKINRKNRYLPKLSLTPIDKQEREVWRGLGEAGVALFAEVCARYGWDGAHPCLKNGDADSTGSEERESYGRSQLA